MSAAPRANMGTAVSKRKTLRNEAMSSVAAKVRWVAAGRRRPRVQGSGPRPSPCGPAAAAGRSPAGGEARLEQGSAGLGAGALGAGALGEPGARSVPRTPPACPRAESAAFFKGAPAPERGPTRVETRTHRVCPLPQCPQPPPRPAGGLGLPTVPVLVPCPLSYSAELSGPGAPSMEHRRSSKTHLGLGHA